MATKSPYHIITIPPLQCSLSNPDATATTIAEKFRTLRLHSLQVNPEAFAAKYEEEVQKPLSQSLERILNPKAIHFVALQTPSDIDPATIEKDAVTRLVHDHWLGMIVLLGPQEDKGENPRDFTSNPFPAFTAGGQLVEPDALLYRINGTFTAPEARGLGLGLKLMQAALGAAVQGGQQFGAAVRVGLAVFAHNVAATKLYEKAGFKIVEDRESRSQPWTRALVMDNVLVPRKLVMENVLVKKT
ncbi:hypothetical protein BDY17DRAFT_292150 [Neohortaea acidophila]|uniref:N-acetyltransferase domain-containing protein n=1 Tax=Neohortaea acidophila TaxID=245834 RepID=A0A6A6Q2T1_9PEZI|nr:uncharacterized protein BDY17DRAFT_292150 [Neohortaea acidophila]KAF2486808.1 hypothetical protein BDY17DRAFT_292150 [Neohortaea acidophila]